MLAFSPAQRIAVVVQGTGLAASCSTTHIGNNVVSKQHLCRIERHTAVRRQRGASGISNRVGSPDGRPAIVPRLPGSKAELVNDGRRQCRDQRPRDHAGRAAYLTVEAIRPIRDTRLGGLRPVSFPRSAERRFVIGIEIMIDADIVLVPVRVIAIAIRRVLTFNTSKPPKARHV